jgi:hypothetical protein
MGYNLANIVLFKEHPEKWHFSASSIVVIALTEAFPYK